MLDWSLLSGAIPVVLRVSAVVAATWLLSRTLRARRQLWVKWVGLTPDGGHLTGGTAGPAGRMSVCRASVGSTPRSFGSRLPAW